MRIKLILKDIKLQLILFLYSTKCNEASMRRVRGATWRPEVQERLDVLEHSCLTSVPRNASVS